MKHTQYRRHFPLFAKNALKKTPQPESSSVVQVNIFTRFLKRLGTGLVRVFKGLCLSLGLMVLLAIIGGVFFVNRLQSIQSYNLPKTGILYYQLKGDLAEQSSTSLFDDPFDTRLNLSELISSLDHAAKDPAIKGLLVSLQSGSYSFAHIQEIHAALDKFRAAGKFSAIHSDSFTDAGFDISPYYLASGFDRIIMQPMGMMSFSGISMKSPYFRRFFDKWGVQPDFLARGKYKSAVENFTRTDMSAPAQEMSIALVNSLWSQIEKTVKTRRKIDTAIVKKALSMGLILDSESVQIGLVDQLGFLGDISKAMLDTQKKQDQEAAFVPLFKYYEHYLSKSDKHQKSQSSVAIVYIDGEIVPFDSEDAKVTSAHLQIQEAQKILGGKQGASAKRIVKSLKQIMDDENVKTVIIRINSPGGSPSASETMRHNIELLRKEYKKKVYVSMGSLAASGGYWVATAGEKIYADPATLTGSIGVFAGKFSLSGLFDKAGVDIDGVQLGDQADLWGMSAPFSPIGAARVQVMLDATYAAFLERVATSRHMSIEQVDAIAQGRVWTGQQALANGLVDELGGLHDVLSKVAADHGVKNISDLNIQYYPQPRSPLEVLVDMADQQAKISTKFQALSNLWSAGLLMNSSTEINPQALSDVAIF